MMHDELANGAWFVKSYSFQMGNIGSEVHRMTKAEKVDQERYNLAFERALELIDLTLSDKRWIKRYKEISRVRELLCGLYLGENLFDIDLSDLDNYFFQFCLSPDCKS